MRTDQILGNCVSPEVDFELNSGKMVFLEFSRKEALLGKTNYNPRSFSLGPIYEKNTSDIDFSTCATARSGFLSEVALNISGLYK